MFVHLSVSKGPLFDPQPYKHMGQNPGTPVNTQKAFKKDYSGVVTNPKKVPIRFWPTTI